MANIKVNLDNTSISMEEILGYKEEVEQIDKILRKDPNNENNFLGWIELPSNYDKVEFKRKDKGYGIVYSYNHRTDQLPGQLYCWAFTSDKEAMSICKTYGTGSTSSDGYIRVPIQ